MRILLALLLTTLTLTGNAQSLSPANYKRMADQEDSMKVYGRKMILDTTDLSRFIADSVFIRMLVRSLKTPYSFNYPFDSLTTVSHIYAPDSSFRIFSWQYMRNENYFRQRGAIQMKTADGSLKLYPLIDISEFSSKLSDSIRTGQNWIGAIYYNIIEKNYKGKNYYTLLGYDDNDRFSTRKWIEVLSFDDNGRPVFGGPYFNLLNTGNSVKGQPAAARFCLEYKKDGRPRLNYDREMDMIVYEHLVSESNEPDKAYTYVPDGDYQAFKWKDGKWIQVDKIFNYKLQDGQAPIPSPIKDAAGKSDEVKLMEQSQKNMSQNNPAPKQPVIKKPATPPPAKKEVPRQPKDDGSY